MCVSVNRALRIRSCRPVCLSLFFHLATESANPFSNSSETLVRLSLPRLACSLNTRHTTYYNTVSPFPLAVHGCKATWYRRLPRFVTPRNLFPHTVNFCPVTKELPAFSPAFRLVPHASGFLLDVPLPSFRFPLCPPIRVAYPQTEHPGGADSRTIGRNPIKCTKEPRFPFLFVWFVPTTYCTHTCARFLFQLCNTIAPTSACTLRVLRLSDFRIPSNGVTEP